MRRVLLRSFTRPPWPWLFGLAAIGLLLSAVRSSHAALPGLCGGDTARLLLAMGPGEVFRLVFDFNLPGDLALDWMLMFVAMMPPLLAVAVMHVRRSVFPRDRVVALASFALAYTAMWMAAGPLLVGAALLLRLLAGANAPLIALVLALIWSASPWQRRALNRSHRLRRIGMFGLAPARDSLVYGIVHGGWCVMSCWAWMLASLVAGTWHVAAMAVVGAMMLLERLRPPSVPRWRWPLLFRTAARALHRAVRPVRVAHG